MALDLSQNPIFLYAIMLGLVSVMFFRVRQLESRILMLDASMDAILTEQTPGDFLPGIDAKFDALSNQVRGVASTATMAARNAARALERKAARSPAATTTVRIEAEEVDSTDSDTGESDAESLASDGITEEGVDEVTVEEVVDVQPRKRRSRRNKSS